MGCGVARAGVGVGVVLAVSLAWACRVAWSARPFRAQAWPWRFRWRGPAGGRGRPCGSRSWALAWSCRCCWRGRAGGRGRRGPSARRRGLGDSARAGLPGGVVGRAGSERGGGVGLAPAIPLARAGDSAWLRRSGRRSEAGSDRRGKTFSNAIRRVRPIPGTRSGICRTDCRAAFPDDPFRFPAGGRPISMGVASGGARCVALDPAVAFRRRPTRPAIATRPAARSRCRSHVPRIPARVAREFPVGPPTGLPPGRVRPRAAPPAGCAAAPRRGGASRPRRRSPGASPSRRRSAAGAPGPVRFQPPGHRESARGVADSVRCPRPPTPIRPRNAWETAEPGPCRCDHLTVGPGMPPARNAEAGADAAAVRQPTRGLRPVADVCRRRHLGQGLHRSARPGRRRGLPRLDRLGRLHGRARAPARRRSPSKGAPAASPTIMPSGGPVAG